MEKFNSKSVLIKLGRQRTQRRRSQLKSSQKCNLRRDKDRDQEKLNLT